MTTEPTRVVAGPREPGIALAEPPWPISATFQQTPDQATPDHAVSDLAPSDRASGPGRTAGPFHVLVVTSEAPPIVSGISRSVDRLAKGLCERGHRVDVLSSVQIPRLAMGEWRLSSFAAFWPAIARRLRVYDVVNLHGPVPTLSDAFLALFRLLPVGSSPVVYTHHSALDIRGAKSLCSIYNRLHRTLSTGATIIVTTSQHYAEVQQVADARPVRVIPWGVDVRPAPPKARGEQEPLRVLFVGQMRGYKGIEWLLPAVADRPEIELTLVGDGPRLRDYQRLSARLNNRNVRFLGRVCDERLHAEYDRSDVLVLPSVTTAEAFGLAVLEGMAAGCVPVVSDLPGVRDLASGVGVLVPPRDAPALQAALLGLATDPERLDRQSRAARQRAEGLSWENCIARYEQALTDAIERARADRWQAQRPRWLQGWAAQPVAAGLARAGTWPA